MSLYEPRCLVCGAPLGREAPFEKDIRKSEVCSDECYETYIAKENAEKCPNCVTGRLETIKICRCGYEASDDL